jgi:2-succinyl-5-enolpyruvyl-6-hydroxy-3-cyclohexene-1-carboxylate synthase
MLRDLRVVVVVLNNDGGGIFSFLPRFEVRGVLRAVLRHAAGRVTFEPAAAMFGLGYERPGTTNEFMEAYRAACAVTVRP